MRIREYTINSINTRYHFDNFCYLKYIKTPKRLQFLLLNDIYSEIYFNW